MHIGYAYIVLLRQTRSSRSCDSSQVNHDRDFQKQILIVGKKMASSSSGSGNGKLAEIHIPLRNAQDTQISTIHAMPFNTDFNGHVPMKAFFNSTICTSDTSEKDTSKEMISMVRGRELKGMTYPVPVGMVGTIIRKDAETGK